MQASDREELKKMYGEEYKILKIKCIKRAAWNRNGEYKIKIKMKAG